MKKQVSKMNDKELDDFFKKLSSSPEIPYVPQDWNKFETLLAKNKGSQPLNGSKWILLGSLILAGLFLVIWLTISNSQTQKKVNINSLAEISSVQTESNLFHKDTFEPHDLPIFSIETSKGNGAKDGSTDAIKSSKTKANLSIPNKTLKVDKCQKSLLFWDSGLKWKVLEEFNQVFPVIENIEIEGSPFVQLQNEPAIFRKNKIALLLMASPDFSAIQFNHIPSSGRNIGFSLEYFFGESWSISIGLMHDQKTYRQGEGYWEGYNKAHKSLVGDCWIIETPLNFRYYPIKRLKHNWFISSGFSSYFMLKEKYSLFYENYGGNDYSEDIEINGKNQHVFGVWNIGLGYEQKLGNNFAIQAEPYFRLPLEGIGAGDLDLKSMGIYFGIKYYPSKHIYK